MFSLFSRSKVDVYDARNPLCATIFHRVHDELMGRGSSKTEFEDAATRCIVDAVFSSGKLSMGDGVEKAEFHYCLGVLERLHKEMEMAEASHLADFFNANQKVLGVHSAVGHVRNLVFGAAPALAPSPEDAYAVTSRTLFCLKGMVARDMVARGPSPFIRAAGETFVVFGMDFDKRRLNQQPRELITSMLDAWVDGYDLAA